MDRRQALQVLGIAAAGAAFLTPKSSMATTRPPQKVCLIQHVEPEDLAVDGGLSKATREFETAFETGCYRDAGRSVQVFVDDQPALILASSELFEKKRYAVAQRALAFVGKERGEVRVEFFVLS